MLPTVVSCRVGNLIKLGEVIILLTGLATDGHPRNRMTCFKFMRQRRHTESVTWSMAILSDAIYILS